MIRVGLIGAGFMGRNHFNQYEKLSDRAAVVAICDTDLARRTGDWSGVGGNLADTEGTKRQLDQIQPYDDWQAMISSDDVDMIDICAPTRFHPEMTIAALRAGKHVLCEKPMALTVEACDQMLEAARESSRAFMIAQCVRFWPEYVYLRQVYTDGLLGKLQSLQLRRHASLPAHSMGNWMAHPEQSGGAILDLHVHDVDFAIQLLGKPDAVTAQGYPSGHRAIDRVHALWHYASADAPAVVALEGYWDMPAGYDFNMGFTAVFEQGAIEWDLAGGKPLTVYKTNGEPETPEMPVGDGYFAEIEHFIHAIEHGQPPSISTPADSRDAVAVAIAEKASIEAGKAHMPIGSPTAS